MTALNARPATGEVAFPLILVEGEEKAGKSYAALQLSNSPKVGRTFVIDLMDGTADEYAELGPYEVLQHDGTHRSMVEQVKAACAVPSDPAKPNVVIVDSATAWWNMLVEWADQRARRGKANKATLAKDPDAEINIGMNIWNDAAGRWGEVALALKKFPGIGVITAQGKEVSALDGDGKPIPNRKVWKVEAHKSLPALVNAWVRMEKPHTATLIGVRSLRVEVPDKGMPLGRDGDMLERVVFEILGAGRAFVPDQSVAPSPSDFDWSGLGWSDKGEHDAARADLKAQCAKMGDAAKDAMKAWLSEQGWSLPYTRAQMDAWRVQIGAGQSPDASGSSGGDRTAPREAARPVLSGGGATEPPPSAAAPGESEPGGEAADGSGGSLPPSSPVLSGPVTAVMLLARIAGDTEAKRRNRAVKMARDLARDLTMTQPNDFDELMADDVLVRLLYDTAALPVQLPPREGEAA